MIGIVGPCGAGKTTLSNLLNENGYSARAIAQEHSYAPSMWKIITNPNFLVFLDASYRTTSARKNFKWSEAEYLEQQHRLRNARFSADLYIKTDHLNPKQIFQLVIRSIHPT